MTDLKWCREIILDYHAKSYRKNHLIESSKVNTTLTPQSDCVDRYKISLVVAENIVEDFSYEGEGCVISNACLSMIGKWIINQTSNQVKNMCHSLIAKILSNEGEITIDGIKCFSNLHNEPGRYNCALLGVRTILQLLAEV